MRKTGPTNPRTVLLIQELKKKATADNAGLWRRLALDLETSTRRRRAVNLSRLNRFTSADEIIVIPGKLLAGGVIDHKITVAALSFSDDAKIKIKAAGGSTLSLEELMKKKSKLSDIRVIG